MRLVQAGLAAVGAFWSELIPAPSPAPSLWDYEGAALAEAEEGVEVWDAPRCPVWGSDCKCDRSPEVTCSALHDSDDLLGREPSHADYDDEPAGSFDPYSMAALFKARAYEWDHVPPPCAHHYPNVPCACYPAHTHDGPDTRPCWCDAPSVAVTVPPVTAQPEVGEAPAAAPTSGLPFMFKASELVDTAAELAVGHAYIGAWCECDEKVSTYSGWVRHLLGLVVSQLVADLTAAYTDQTAALRAAADARIQQKLADAGFMETGQDMGGSSFASEFFPQWKRDDR